MYISHSISLQDAKTSSFIDVYQKYGVLQHEAMKLDLSNLVLTAMHTGNQFLTSMFAAYFKKLGFQTASDIATFCEKNRQSTFTIQVLLIAMINHLYIRIMTLEGDYHTHPNHHNDIYRCTVHLALEQGIHGPEYVPLHELSQKEIEKQRKWVTCKPAIENKPCSKTTPRILFHAERKDKGKDSVANSHHNEPLDLCTPKKNTEEVTKKQDQNNEPLDLKVPTCRSPHLSEHTPSPVKPKKFQHKKPSQKHQQKKDKTVHHPAGELRCPVCLKTFGQKFNLTKHMIIHSGKHYICKKCQYKAKSLYHLSDHKVQCVHGVTYPCKVAGYEAVYKHRFGLFHHILSAHK